MGFICIYLVLRMSVFFSFVFFFNDIDECSVYGGLFVVIGVGASLCTISLNI